MVLVRKENNKWCMYVVFTDLSVTCIKEPYPLRNIDRHIDGFSYKHNLTFMATYSGYKQTQMDPSYSPKIAFISNHDNYYNNIMSFGLKNDGTTYQRLMDAVFLYHIGWNL